MKRTLLPTLLLVCFAFGANAQQAEPLPIDSAVRVGKLENGLTYYIRHNELPKQRAEFHIAQGVGAILEEDDQNGLAHFLEHMAFNGTEHFPGKGIINYFESIGVNFGGNINAYTSLDQTVYRLSDVPTIRESIIDSALLVMHDWSCGLLLDGTEIDNERGVIREEWRTGATAARRIWKRSNELMYPGSQYAKRDVIGDTAVINNFAYDVLRAYYHKWYGPDLQAIIVVGDIDVDQVENKIKALWADVPARTNRGERPIYSVEDNTEPIVAVITDKEEQVTRIRLTYKKEPLPDTIKGTAVAYTLDLCHTLICGMLNNRFSELAQKPDASFVGAGAFYSELVKAKDAFTAIYVPKEGQEAQAYKDLLIQLEKMRRYGFTTDEYERAKTDMLSRYEKDYNERNAVRNINYAHAYINNYLDQEPIPGIAWEYNLVKQILPLLPLNQINALAQTFVTQENLIVLITAPDKESVVIPSQAALIQEIEVARTAEIEAPKEEILDKNLVKKTPRIGKIQKTTYNQAYGTTEWTLSNGVRVIIKPTQFKQDEINLNAYSAGGYAYVATEDLPSAELATDLIELSGLGDYNATQLGKVLAGKYVSLNASIDNYSESLHGQSTIRDFETLLQLTYLTFTAPRKDQEAYNTLLSLLETQLKNKANNPKAVFRDSVTMMSTNYSDRTILWNEETIQRMSFDKAYQIFTERFANPREFTFFFTGNIDPQDKQTQKLICQWIGSISSNRKALERSSDVGIRAPKGIRKNYFTHEMTTRTASNRIQYTAPMDYNLSNELNMEMIGRILSTRYLESIREREGGSYGVSCGGVLNRQPVGTARLLMQFDTDPEKQERLMSIIHEEVNTIIENGPLASDLQKEKVSMLKDFEEDLEKNGYWNGLFLPEYYIWKVDYLKEYEAAVNALTAESVQQTLKKLVDAGNVFEVVMLPK